MLYPQLPPRTAHNEYTPAHHSTNSAIPATTSTKPIVSFRTPTTCNSQFNSNPDDNQTTRDQPLSTSLIRNHSLSLLTAFTASWHAPSRTTLLGCLCRTGELHMIECSRSLFCTLAVGASLLPHGGEPRDIQETNGEGTSYYYYIYLFIASLRASVLSLLLLISFRYAYRPQNLQTPGISSVKWS